MSEKKARASVFFIIAIVAFICSCIVFSMTGGVYDWVGEAMTNDTDNTTEDFGLSEFLNQSEDSDDYNYNNYDNSSDSDSDSGDDSSSILNDLTNNDKDSKHSDSGKSDSSQSSSYEQNPME